MFPQCDIYGFFENLKDVLGFPKFKYSAGLLSFSFVLNLRTSTKFYVCDPKHEISLGNFLNEVIADLF